MSNPLEQHHSRRHTSATHISSVSHPSKYSNNKNAANITVSSHNSTKSSHTRQRSASKINSQIGHQRKKSGSDRSGMIFPNGVSSLGFSKAGGSVSNMNSKSSRRSSVGSTISSNFHDDRSNLSGRNVMIVIENAKIFTYSANPPSSLRRTVSMDSNSLYSLRRVESIESIKTNISEILNENGEGDNESINSRSKVMNGKGRLLAHGSLQIYEIEGGISYLSCGGKSKTTRDSFVHPLLPKLKIFKVNDITFILMLSHPDRFWKIIFDINQISLEAREEYKQNIVQLEKLLKKLCCFIDFLQTPQLNENKFLKKPPIIEKAPKQINTNILNNKVLTAEQKPLENNTNNVKKGKIGNRLSKFFKTKNKSKISHDEKENGENDSSPSSYSPNRYTNGSVDNGSSTNLSKSNPNIENQGSLNDADYNDYIDKLIEKKVEAKVRMQMQETQDKFFPSPAKSVHSSDSESSSDSVLYNIIEESKLPDHKDEFNNPETMIDFTEKLNNDVSAEIFKDKRRSLVISDDLLLRRLQKNAKKSNGEVFHSPEYSRSDTNRKSSSMSRPSWMNVNEINQSEIDEDMEADLILMVTPSTNLEVPTSRGTNSLYSRPANQSSTRLNNTRSFVKYNPHPNFDEELNSRYSSKTFKNNSKLGSVKNFKSAGSNFEKQSDYSYRPSVFGGTSKRVGSESSFISRMTNSKVEIKSKEIYNLVQSKDTPESNQKNSNDCNKRNSGSGFLTKVFGW